MKNLYLQETFYKFSFILITSIDEFNEKVLTNLSKSKIILIDEYQRDEKEYHFICFDYQFIIISKNNSFLDDFLSKK